MNFSKGDKVRVCSEEVMEQFAKRTDKDFDIVDDMYDYCDTVYTVYSIVHDMEDNIWVQFEEDGGFYSFHEDLLELECIKVRDVEVGMCFKRHGYRLMVAGIVRSKTDEDNDIRLLMVTNEENFGWKVRDNDGYFRDDEGIKYYDELRFQPEDGSKWISGWWYRFNADKTMEELLFDRFDSDKFIVDTLKEDEVVEEEVKDIPAEDEKWLPTHVLHVASEVNDIAEYIREANKRIDMLRKLGFDTYLTDNVITCSKDGVTYSVVID